MRWVTSFLWLFVTLALGFDAVAQPCELRSSSDTPLHIVEHVEMPCHDALAAMKNTETQNEMPEHQSDTCCCAALLKTVVSLDSVDLKQPLPTAFAWSIPIDITADSIAFEYEPPPPRA